MALSYDKLKNGDVLLKYATWKATNVLIKVGEALFSHNRSGGTCDIIHAALYAGDRGGQKIVYEASGPGLVADDISGLGYRYEVYRYKQADVAEIASVVAEGYTADTARERAKNPKKHYGAYSILGAGGSLFHSSARGKEAVKSEKGLWGHSEKAPARTFYCSSFVVRAYLAAGQTMEPVVVPIDADYRHISPKELQARLNKDARWQHLGLLVS